MKYKGLLSITVAIRLPWDFKSPRNSIFLPPRRASPWIPRWISYARDFRNRSRSDFRKRANALRDLLNRNFLVQFSGWEGYRLESLAQGSHREGDARYKQSRSVFWPPNNCTIPMSLQFGTAAHKEASANAMVTTDDVENSVNEFVIEPSSRTQPNHYAVRDCIAHVIAVRRSQLYHPAAAVRRHNVFLPPGELSVIEGQSRSRFIVVAYLSFFRNPDCVRVRRTFTFNTVFVPVRDDDGPAEITMEKARSFMASIGIHPSKKETKDGMKLTGDLPSFLYGGTPEGEFEGLKDLGRKLVKQLPPFCASATNRRRDEGKRDAQISAILRNQLSASVICIAALAVVSGDGVGYGVGKEIDDQMLAEFYISNLHKSWDWSCLEKECRDGAEVASSYFGYLNECSAAGCVLTVADASKERFPQWSILWNFGWYAHLATALASARQLVHSFHHELDKRPRDFRAFLALTEEFTTDFDESYGLDLKANQFKQQHQRALEISGLDRDRQELDRELSKFSESQDARTMHRLTRWILALTAIVVVSAVVTLWFARAGRLTSGVAVSVGRSVSYHEGGSGPELEGAKEQSPQVLRASGPP